MRLNDEIILLIMTELASGYPGTATEFSQVDLIDVELITLLHIHLFDGMC